MGIIARSKAKKTPAEYGSEKEDEYETEDEQVETTPAVKRKGGVHFQLVAELKAHCVIIQISYLTFIYVSW